MRRSGLRYIVIDCAPNAMDRSFQTAKRLLRGTTGCRFSAETATFASAALLSTQSVAFFAAIKYSPGPKLVVTLTTAKSPSYATRTTKSYTCPYRAVGYITHAVFALTDNTGVANFEHYTPRLVITPTTPPAAHTVERAVHFAAEACSTTLHLQTLAPLSFLVFARSKENGIYLELQHLQFVVAPVNGHGEVISVGFAPEESINLATYKWTLTAATEWTECQLCLQLAKAAARGALTPNKRAWFS